jgi:15-cis-phytoene synthase
MTPARITPGPPVDIDAALDLCERITWSHAPTLYTEIKVLPAYRRRALCAICAFVQRLAEIANGDLHPYEKLELLGAARAGIAGVGSARPDDPVLVALRDTRRRFALPLDRFDDIIDGIGAIACEVAYESFEDFVWHCRFVAGSVGRLAAPVLGSRDPAAAAVLAGDLAVAMWLIESLDNLAGCYRPVRGDGTLNTDLLNCARKRLARGLDLIAILDARGAAFVTAMASRCERLLDRSDTESSGGGRVNGHRAVPGEYPLVTARRRAGVDRRRDDLALRGAQTWTRATDRSAA